MSEKRFVQVGDTSIKDTLTGERYYAPCEDDLLDLLNEQQATITELERKVKKYAKIGEEQLKQIMDLQDELNECRARPTLATDERGVVKVEYR